jgi:hypothetical protein
MVSVLRRLHFDVLAYSALTDKESDLIVDVRFEWKADMVGDRRAEFSNEASSIRYAQMAVCYFGCRVEGSMDWHGIRRLTLLDLEAFLLRP